MFDEQLAAPTTDADGQDELTTTDGDDAAQVIADSEDDVTASSADDPVDAAEAAPPDAEVEAAEQESSDADASLSTESDADDGPSVDPEVREYIGQDTTVVHPTHGGGGPVKSPFRTPPGIPSGLDPGTPEERDA